MGLLSGLGKVVGKVFGAAAGVPEPVWDIAGGLIGNATGPRVQGRTASAEMRSKILTGRQFGLHPLASIGAQTSGYSGNYLGDALAQVGDRVAQGKSDKKADELVDAQIAESRSRTLLNQAEAAARAPRRLDPHLPGGGRDPAFQDTPLVQRVHGPGGKRGYGLNPDAFEIGLGELITGAAMYGPQFLWQYGKDAAAWLQEQQGPPAPGRPRTTTRGMKRRAPWEH